MFEGAGASESRVLLVRDRYDARNSGLAEALEGLTGLFFSGGDQTKLVRALRDSPFLDRVMELWRRGMAVGGTSAGASAMSATMIASGRSGLMPRRGMVRLGEGLGFLDRLIVDQHFGRRNRLGRLLLALNRHPELIGVGLCEGTALCIEHDGTAEVQGERAVFVLRKEKTLPETGTRPGPERVGGATLQVLVEGDRQKLW
jgi:cyanophycinase